VIARGPLGLAAIALMALAAPAEALTLPVNRLVVDLPGWQIHRAIGDKNVDLLRSKEHGNLAVGFVDTDCATFFTQQEAALGTALTPETAFAVPPGWEIRSWKPAPNTTYLGCHRGNTITIAVEWWPMKDYSWATDIKAALAALDGARRLGGISARDDLIPLAGLPAIQVPESLRVSLIERGSTARDSPHDGLAVFTLGSGEKVTFRKGMFCTNLNAFMDDWNKGEVSAPRSDRWKKWTNGKIDGFCIDRLSGEGVWLVLGPADDPSVAMLLESIEGELYEPLLQHLAPLPATGWVMEIPRDAKATKMNGADRVTGGGIDLTVRRAASCAATEPTGSRERYEPSWLAGWNGVVDQTAGIVTLCLVVQRGALEISLPASQLTGRTRRTIGDVLERASFLATTNYEPPRGHLLPYPLEVGFQTTKGGERGFGPRVAFQISTRGGFARARAEVGWDSGSGLSYDANAAAGLMFGKFGASVTGGFDAVGSGDTQLIASAPYGGVVLRLGAADGRGDGWASLNLTILRRYQAADDDLHPTNEFRFGLDMFHRAGLGFLNALKIEYQSYGDRNMFQLTLGTNL